MPLSSALPAARVAPVAIGIPSARTYKGASAIRDAALAVVVARSALKVPERPALVALVAQSASAPAIPTPGPGVKVFVLTNATFPLVAGGTSAALWSIWKQ